MASYLVMMPPEGETNPDSARFIRDGFSLAAFVFPLLWLLWNRLWLYTLVYVLVVIGLGVAAEEWASSDALVVAQLALSLLIGLEGGTIRAGHLVSKGWKMVAVIPASSLDEAEEIYFASADMPSPAGPQSMPLPSGLARSHGAPVLGLLDYGKGY
ncbi:DUF2628 domain-containing protein [Gellertiella hungarica]|uniref:DUF2628 domain-containing protein n=1 Tax=Gellertiella hungarica TaxID=1572859 RepID=A0A7W6J8U3_9HYPH|nr:DUF2628 domain-containing protein [Gellertiella hungarica]MBB4066898.1 hypothetical protein [Gellertiella hungarica]